ncbi:MAG: tetratricopeptide repeat protein [Chloroflexi bacterium]|nr:tetratricopeptide repeat protein [Chloroflexota bacterium]
MFSTIWAISLHQIQQYIGERGVDLFKQMMSDHTPGRIASEMDTDYFRSVGKDVVQCLRLEYRDITRFETALRFVFSEQAEIRSAFIRFSAGFDTTTLFSTLTAQIKQRVPDLTAEDAERFAATFLACLQNAVYRENALLTALLVIEIKSALPGLADKDVQIFVQAHLDFFQLTTQDLAFGTWNKFERYLIERQHGVQRFGVELDAPTTRLLDLLELIKQSDKSFSSKFVPLPLPVEGALPDKGPLPPKSRLPYTRDPYFIGHDKDLLKIASWLLHGPEGVKTASVSGTDNIHFCNEFCYRYGRYFQRIFWTQLPETMDHIMSIADMLYSTTLSNFQSQLSTDIIAGITPDSYQQQNIQLFVLENLENEHILREWLKGFGKNARVLIISKRRYWSHDLNIFTHQLHPPIETSRQILRDSASHLIEVTDHELDEIAVKVRHLPLALTLAGRYMHHTQCTPADYLSLLHQRAPLQNPTFAENGHPASEIQNVMATIALMWELIQDTDDVLAQRMFLCAGYCAPDVPVPHELLHIAASDLNEKLHLEPALKRLHYSGLLQIESEYLTIHPLAAHFAREVDKGEHIDRIVCVLTIAQYMANGYESPYRPLLIGMARSQICIHAEYVASHSSSLYSGALWNVLGYRHAGEEALVRFTKAVHSFEATFGPDHPHVALALYNLGVFLQSNGNVDEAGAVYERAVHILETYFGADYWLIAPILYRIGDMLHAAGDEATAQTLLDRVCLISVIYSQRQTVERLKINNLDGMFLRDLNETFLTREVYRIRLRIFAGFRIDMFFADYAVQHLAEAMTDLGDYLGAKEAYLLLRRWEETDVYGRHRHNILNVINLGRVFYHLGNYYAAHEYLAHALQIYESAFGRDHPWVAPVLNDLGRVLLAQGDHEAARDALERGLYIDETYFGDDHYHVTQYLNSLSVLWRQLGDYEKAKTFIERALSIDEPAFGPDHIKRSM